MSYDGASPSLKVVLVSEYLTYIDPTLNGGTMVEGLLGSPRPLGVMVAGTSTPNVGTLGKGVAVLLSDHTISTANTATDVYTQTLPQGIHLVLARVVVSCPGACQVTATLRDSAGELASAQRTAHTSGDVLTLWLAGISDQSALTPPTTALATIAVACTVTGAVALAGVIHNLATGQKQASAGVALNLGF